MDSAAKAIADSFSDQRIETPAYTRVSREKESAILKLSALGKTQTEIATIVGVSQPTVSRTLAEFTDTRDHAKAILNKSAARLTERVVNDADVAEALDVLERIGVIAPKQGNDGSQKGVQVVVLMPGQASLEPPVIDVTHTLSPPVTRQLEE